MACALPCLWKNRETLEHEFSPLSVINRWKVSLHRHLKIKLLLTRSFSLCLSHLPIINSLACSFWSVTQLLWFVDYLFSLRRPSFVQMNFLVIHWQWKKFPKSMDSTQKWVYLFVKHWNYNDRSNGDNNDENGSSNNGDDVLTNQACQAHVIISCLVWEMLPVSYVILIVRYIPP